MLLGADLGRNCSRSGAPQCLRVRKQCAWGGGGYYLACFSVRVFAVLDLRTTSYLGQKSLLCRFETHDRIAHVASGVSAI